MNSSRQCNGSKGSLRQSAGGPISNRGRPAHSMNRRLHGCVSEFLSNGPAARALETLLEALEPETDVFVVGGVLRNLAAKMLHGASPPTEDIDIFLSNCDSLPTLSPVTVTDLGGIQWLPRTCPISFDICLLKNFVILRKYRMSPSLENLMASIDFTMNALVYDVRRKHLLDGGATDDIGKHLMEFNSPMFYSRPLTAYRILLLRQKTGFMLSSAVFQYIKQQIDIDTLLALQKILSARFDRDGRDALWQEYDRLCAFPDYDAYRANAAEAVMVRTYGSSLD
ncbi:hypothetical protein D3OALGA1CA_2347 [Olavius algarvensis associated proteobacterium Delta 3]|nr:hypothetical protein D3OALGA1CA_2347 [Olavius algarvensis associated proteobacterium Delta 3]